MICATTDEQNVPLEKKSAVQQFLDHVTVLRELMVRMSC